MPRLRRVRLSVGAVSGLLLLLASLDRARAEPDPAASPTLSCATRALRIMAPEVSGASIRCEVSGAAADDQAFLVQAVRAVPPTPDRPRPPSRDVCSGTLQAGVGACIGVLVDRSSPDLDGLLITGTLLPSGTAVQVALAPPPTTPPAPPSPAPLEFEPLPLPGPDGS